MAKIAIYPGSFDPITKGHVDIIQRASMLFDKLIIVVSENIYKKYLFTVQERIDLVSLSLKHLPNIEIVVAQQELTVDLAARLGAGFIIRGLRNSTDFKYEMELSMTNAHLNGEIETVFLVAKQEHMFVSSSVVKEIAKFKGDFSKFVPEPVLKPLEKKFVE